MTKCPNCSSNNVIKRGTFPRQRYQCKKCTRFFYEEDKFVPNVILFDIETLPLQVYSWGVNKQFVNYDGILKDWCILSWVAKPLFGQEITSRVLTPKEAVARNDKRIVGDLWSMFNKADVIVAHNGAAFDIAKTNDRFLVNGFPPPSAYKMIDTKVAASKHFGFTCNKLDYLAKHLGLNPKIKTDFDLWKECDKGNKDALKKMEIYNRQDVLTLEDVYVLLRPWIKSHPNMSLYITTDKDVELCPHCAHDDLDWDGGFYYTSAYRYETARCNHCGAVIRTSKNNRSRTKKNSTTRVVA